MLSESCAVASSLSRWERSFVTGMERDSGPNAVLWVLSLPVVAGLIPLGTSVSAWLAPGILAARPDDVWWTAALSTEEVFWSMAGLVLAGGMAGSAAAWGAQHADSEPLGRAVLWGAAGLALVGLVHAVAGMESAFGWIDTTQTAAGPFFGPLVNPNHVGGVLLLQVLNILRIVTLYWIGAHFPDIFATSHEVAWPSILIVVTIATWIIWVRFETPQEVPAPHAA